MPSRVTPYSHPFGRSEMRENGGRLAWFGGDTEIGDEGKHMVLIFLYLFNIILYFLSLNNREKWYKFYATDTTTTTIIINNLHSQFYH